MGLISKIIGAILAGFGIVVLGMGMDPAAGSMAYVYFIIGLVMMSIGVNFMLGTRKQPVDEPKPPTVTEIRCGNPECNFKEIRDFQIGDYILKPIDVPCPKCGIRSTSMTIEGIYVIREESEQFANI